VLVVAYNIIEAAMWVYLSWDCDAVLDIFEFLEYRGYIVAINICRTSLTFLLVSQRILLVEIKSLDRILKNLNNLLTSIFFVIWAVRSWHKSLVVNLLVYLR